LVLRTGRLKESYTFKKFIFYVSSLADKFDKNVVGRLFTYLDDSTVAAYGLE